MVRQLNTQSLPLLVVRRMRKFVFLLGQKQNDDGNQTFLRLVQTSAVGSSTLAFPSSSKF